MKEKQDNQHYYKSCLYESYQHIINRFSDEISRVHDHSVVDAFGEVFLKIIKLRFNLGGHFKRIGSRKLIYAEKSGLISADEGIVAVSFAAKLYFCDIPEPEH